MTQQISDIIDINGNTYSLYDWPLTQYQWKKQIDLLSTVSVCWRGYTAHWSIYNKRLFLKAVKLIDMKLALDDYLEFEQPFPVFADWYSGYLMFYEKDSEIVMCCQVINGIVIPARSISKNGVIDHINDERSDGERSIKGR